MTRKIPVQTAFDAAHIDTIKIPTEPISTTHGRTAAPLRIASLCSGVGALDLAVEFILRANLAWYAQYEPPDKNGREDKNQYAAQIMAARFPGVPNHGDITTIDYTQVEPVDILTAGFPCTDLSLAGKRAGLMPGTRSGIWSHVARAVEALHPSLVFIENVRSLTSAKAHSDLEHCPWCMGEAAGGGSALPPLRALGAVLGDLADLRFDAEWVVLPASAVGAPHKRERCFVLAWPADRSPRADWWASSADAHQSARGERWVAASRQAEVGRSWSDARGRGGAPASHADGERHGNAGQARIGGFPAAALGGAVAAPADPAHLGYERDRAARDGRPGPEDGRLGDVPSVARGVGSNAPGDGRDEGRPESARELGRPDVAERRGAPADAPGTGLEARGEGRPGASSPADPDRDAVRRQPVSDAGRIGAAEPELSGVRRLAASDADGRRRGSGESHDAARQPDIAWGDYEPAIRRWEAVLGRPAPRPVDDRGRLAAPFVEWLMGLPDGWVTGASDIPRNAQLKALGNGVVWQQGAAALRILLNRTELSR